MKNSLQRQTLELELFFPTSFPTLWTPRSLVLTEKWLSLPPLLLRPPRRPFVLFWHLSYLRWQDFCRTNLFEWHLSHLRWQDFFVTPTFFVFGHLSHLRWQDFYRTPAIFDFFGLFCTTSCSHPSFFFVSRCCSLSPPFFAFVLFWTHLFLDTCHTFDTDKTFFHTTVFWDTCHTRRRQDFCHTTFFLRHLSHHTMTRLLSHHLFFLKAKSRTPRSLVLQCFSHHNEKFELLVL